VGNAAVSRLLAIQREEGESDADIKSPWLSSNPMLIFARSMMQLLDLERQVAHTASLAELEAVIVRLELASQEAEEQLARGRAEATGEVAAAISSFAQAAMTVSGASVPGGPLVSGAGVASRSESLLAQSAASLRSGAQELTENVSPDGSKLREGAGPDNQATKMQKAALIVDEAQANIANARADSVRQQEAIITALQKLSDQQQSAARSSSA
jgi:hypothetical protein